MSASLNRETVAVLRTQNSWIVPGRSVNVVASFRAHRKLALILFVTILAAGLVAAQILGRPRYHAEAVVRVSPRAPTEQGAAFSQTAYIPDYRNFLQQQVFEISSYATTNAALESLGAKRSLWQKPGENNRHAAERLLWSLKVQLVPDTYLLSVGLDGDHPGGLAEIVNAVVNAYLSREEKQELSGTGQGMQLLSKQSAKIQQQIDSEREQQSKLAQELGVSGFETGLTNPFAKLLVDANEALERSRRDLISAQAHLESVREQQDHARDFGVDPIADQMVLDNPGVSNAKAVMFQRREADFLQLQGLGPKHPGRPALETEIQEINDELARIDSTARNQVRSILLANQDAKARIAISDADAEVDEAQRVQDDTEKEVTALRTKVASTSAKYSLAVALHENIENQSKQIKGIDDEIRSMQLQTQSPGFAALATAASTPDVPEKGKRKLLMALFALAALGLAAAAAIGVDITDQRIKTPAELEAIMGFEPLGGTPSAGKRSAQTELKRIALGIIRQRRVAGIRTFVFTPVSAGTDTTSLALALARTLDDLGAKTVVIEANAASPDRRYLGSHHGNGSITRPIGFDDFSLELAPAVSLSNGKVHAISEDNDSLPARISICRHEGVPNFSMECAQSLIELALKDYDLVLLDAPPLLDSADAAMVIQIPSGAILVVKTGHDTLAEIEATARELEKLEPSVVGTIMTSAASEKESVVNQLTDAEGDGVNIFSASDAPITSAASL
jgi:polysaccharide biosynthesis transport protein